MASNLLEEEVAQDLRQIQSGNVPAIRELLDHLHYQGLLGFDLDSWRARERLIRIESNEHVPPRIRKRAEYLSWDIHLANIERLVQENGAEAANDVKDLIAVIPALTAYHQQRVIDLVEDMMTRLENLC